MRKFIILSRLDQPIGIWLLLLPALWSITLAGGINYDSIYIMALFAIGAIVMRSAECVINDIFDKDIDSKIARTADRPIASGEISRKSAVVFTICLLLIGAIILFQLNTYTILLGFVSLPLIIAYPLMKRITWWPQLFLGITINFGALMGWSAVSGHLSITAFLIYASGIFWTLGYDTIYAHQDINDDELVGVKSTARLFGENSKTWVGIFYLATMIFLSIAFGGFLFLIPAAAHLIWQMRSWRPSENSAKIFKSNRDFGFLVFCSAILEAIF